MRPSTWHPDVLVETAHDRQRVKRELVLAFDDTATPASCSTQVPVASPLQHLAKYLAA
jgi:hypothetical protein